jgi:dTDP-4-dehydrorhamnose reductase
VIRPVLVLGGTGRLGSALQAECAARRMPCVAPAHAALDLDDPGAIPKQLAAHDAGAVINAAGFTDVDAAERPEHRASAIRRNAEGPGALARACARAGIDYVHVSTDYVFDGASSSPYREDDPVRPIQVYGASKLEGERAVAQAYPEALIARVSTLYGLARRPAYVDKILAAARARGEGALDVVVHPVSSPTYAVDVAPALLDLLARKASGIVHVVNDGAASRLELAQEVVTLAGLAGRVALRARPEAAGALARPAYSVLDTAKLQSLLGRRLPPWKDALARYLAGAGRAAEVRG